MMSTRTILVSALLALAAATLTGNAEAASLRVSSNNSTSLLPEKTEKRNLAAEVGYGFIISHVRDNVRWCLTAAEGATNHANLGLALCDFVGMPDNQMWRFDDDGKIHTRLNDSKCMVAGYGTRTFFNGIRMRIHDCNISGTTFNQFNPLDDHLTFVTRPNYCITNRGSSPHSTDTIHAKRCKNRKDHRWTFLLVNTQQSSAMPSASPSALPTSMMPSFSPSAAPSAAPSSSPSVAPSFSPSAAPSMSPSAAPSEAPSAAPSLSPTAAPSAVPSFSPSTAPSMSPTVLADGPVCEGLDGMIGDTTCACSPSTFEFMLDFGLTCSDKNVTSPGVSQDACIISPFGDPEVSDLVPVRVQSIDVLELNQNLQILTQENIAGDFQNGDSFTYQSASATCGTITAQVDVPRGIQVNIIGVNAADEPIINVFLLLYTNTCGVFPVLELGNSIGWTILTAVGDPLYDFCPL